MFAGPVAKGLLSVASGHGVMAMTARSLWIPARTSNFVDEPFSCSFRFVTFVARCLTSP